MRQNDDHPVECKYVFFLNNAGSPDGLLLEGNRKLGSIVVKNTVAIIDDQISVSITQHECL